MIISHVLLDRVARELNLSGIHRTNRYSPHKHAAYCQRIWRTREREGEVACAK